MNVDTATVALRSHPASPRATRGRGLGPATTVRAVVRRALRTGTWLLAIGLWFVGLAVFASPTADAADARSPVVAAAGIEPAPAGDGPASNAQRCEAPSSAAADLPGGAAADERSSEDAAVEAWAPDEAPDARWAPGHPSAFPPSAPLAAHERPPRHSAHAPA